MLQFSSITKASIPRIFKDEQQSTFFFHEISCILILNEALKVLFNVSEEQYYEIFNFKQENYLSQTCNDDNDANSCKTLCNVESD